MSEVTENMNEQVEEEVDDAAVVTVPIDETLTRHGEAADAKAVGDALAAMVTDVTVDGQGKDASGNILVKAEHIPYSTGTGGKSVAQKIDEVNAKNATQIPVSDQQGAQTIAQALAALGEKTAAQILMSSDSVETVADRIGGIEDDLDDAVDTINQSISDNVSALEQSIGEVDDALDAYKDATDGAIDDLEEAIDTGLTELTDAEIHAIVAEVFEDEEEAGE